ncbi:nuclear transport factor 2 family protein [Chitinimonas sp.]|uniref:nuclear transport factor 2 family protein n=1 Tax=Chitinimonas sp. TaxID=1934313 RepID=UPI002F920512
MHAPISRYLDAYNRLDVDAMLQFLHPEVVFENYANGELNTRTDGIASFRELAEHSLGLFLRRRQTLLEHAEVDGLIQAEIDFEGVFAVDLPNGIRAGQEIKLRGRSDFRLQDGLIIYVGDHC